jgi:YHS domain-containing protein
VQDPLPNIIKHNLNFQCAVNKDQSAKVEESTMRQVNWEIYLFNDSLAANEFDSDPVKYCGILTDPVSRQRFRPGYDSPTSDFEGHRFYFWTADSKQKFEMMPAFYSAPNIRMEELKKESDTISAGF